MLLDIDKPRKRIALTLRLDDGVGPGPGKAVPAPDRAAAPTRPPGSGRKMESSGGALADALRRAGLK
jgi:uncharacterized protein